MPNAKFAKRFDYIGKREGPMTSYEAGYEGDIPASHLDAATEAGVLETSAPKAPAQPKPDK